MNEFEKPISPSPFANLTEAELLFLLKNKKDSLTPAQILDVQARLSNFQQLMKQEDARDGNPPAEIVPLPDGSDPRYPEGTGGQG